MNLNEFIKFIKFIRFIRSRASACGYNQQINNTMT